MNAGFQIQFCDGNRCRIWELLRGGGCRGGGGPRSAGDAAVRGIASLTLDAG